MAPKCGTGRRILRAPDSGRPHVPEQGAVPSEIARRSYAEVRAFGEGEHAVDRTVRAATDFRIDVDFVRAGLEHFGEVREAVHRHPGTMRAAFAGGAGARRRC